MLKLRALLGQNKRIDNNSYKTHTYKDCYENVLYFLGKKI